jgi:hypothetical protein
VQHIVTDDTAARTYTLLNAAEESEKQYDDVSDLLTRVNMTRDSMDEDEDNRGDELSNMTNREDRFRC